MRLGALGAACGAVLAVAGAGCRPRAAAFDNVVLVVVDTLRRDHLPSYGYGRDTAPALARLAREGLQRDGYAASSWTKPSVATLLTGLHPQRHQAQGERDALPEAAPYLPDLLRRRGWHTAAFVANGNVGREFGFARGYERFEQWSAPGKADGEQVTAAALELARALRPPFFLSVHYVDPHTPYQPRRSFGASADTTAPRLREALEDRVVSPEEVSGLVDAYDGEILEADAAVGRLLAGLGARELLRRTLVVVTADHGEEFGEHGGFTHGRTLYEEVLRVPFLAWSADGGLRAVGAGTFHHVDFVPTVLGALGVEAPAGLDGVGRGNAFGAGDAPWPQFFHLDYRGRAALAVREGRFKLLHQPAAPYSTLADLVTDPGERRPRARLRPSGRRLLELLLRHHDLLAARALPRRVARFDDEVRTRLQALGYLRGGEHAARAMPPRLDPRHGFGGREPAAGALH